MACKQECGNHSVDVWQCFQGTSGFFFFPLCGSSQHSIPDFVLWLIWIYEVIFWGPRLSRNVSELGVGHDIVCSPYQGQGQKLVPICCLKSSA